MAKVKLSESTFTVIPDGEHIFKVEKVEYDEDFGKMEVTLVTADGLKTVERYNMLDSEGEVNEKARNAFSFFARVALNNPNADEVDTDDLVGCYFKATVTHDEQPSKKDPKKTVVFVKLSDRKAATGFDKKASRSEVTPNKKKPSVDLDDLLG